RSATTALITSVDDANQNECGRVVFTGVEGAMTESPNHLPQLVSSKQAARMLGIPEGTLRYWRCIGRRPAWVKLGRRTLYSVDDLVEFIARGRRDPSVRTMEVDDVSL